MKKVLWLIGLVLLSFLSQAQTKYYARTPSGTGAYTTSFKQINQVDVLGLPDTIAAIRADITSGGITQSVLNDTASALRTAIATKVNISDTASMLAPYLREVDTTSLSNRINLKLNISDTAAMLSPYALDAHTHAQSDITNLVSDLALKAPLASPTFTGTTITSNFYTNATSTDANLAVFGITASSFSTSQLQIGGASSTSARVIERGTGSPTITAGNSFGSHILGTVSLNEAGSLNHPLLANLAIKPLNIVGGSATVSNTATLYIEAAAATTVSGDNFALWVDDGHVKFDDSLTVSGTAILPSTTSIGSVTNTEIGYLSGVTSALQTQINGKQATLVSATNIKTINGNSLLGSGDLVIGGGTLDATPTDGSTNGVESNGVFDALGLKANLASPTFTGTPAAPTAAVGTNTTQIATTAFVQANKTQRVVLASDQANSNTNGVWEDVTGLEFPVTANKTYKFKFVISFDAALQTTGSKWAISGPTLTRTTYKQANSMTVTQQFFNENNGYDQGSTASSSAFATGNICIIEGVIRCSASGDVVARHATEVTGSAITAKADYSYVEYEQLD
jgi:hypothetical protein